MDKLPLQNILRQLLCGAVFFAPIGLLLPNEVIKSFIGFHVKDMGTFWLGCAFVLSLAVGTLIYHIEKNFYSYAIQILMEKRCAKETESGKIECPSMLVRTAGLWGINLTILALGTCMIAEMKVQQTVMYLFIGVSFLLGVCVVLFSKRSDKWKKSFWPFGIFFVIEVSVVLLAYFNSKFEFSARAAFTSIIFIGLIVGFVFLLCWLRCRDIRSIAKRTRELWLAESGEQEDKTNSVIMRRVANWSDFIHCGQCCAFAWILGSFCVLCYCLRYYDSKNVPYTRINIGLLCSLLLLSLELIADWHRYHHVLYVLNNKSDEKSQPNPTSNSHQ